MERKLATVLFVDLVGSTSLVSAQDPEVVRRRMARFFDEVSHHIESHGGMIEKFAGDAVLAGFGLDQAHEDDTERAIRAALAIEDAMPDLAFEVRMGIEAGEVVVEEGGDSTFATGEAINVAARLEQGAEPGDILIGPVARRLAAGCADLESVGLLELKGFDGPIEAWRLLGTGVGSPDPHSLSAPLVGRDAELELLENTFARAVHGGRPHLFTIYGEPGVGKSRVAREFVEGVEGATVLSGRCLPYGEGITYWPLAEMVKTVAGISDDDPIDEAFEKLRACCEDEAVADLLGLASGVLEALEAERSQQEIAWAAREFIQKLAETQPVVLVFEDIHWAEEPLLELIEHVGDLVRAPVLVVCLARPELLEVHPGWGGGRVRATAIELEPLGQQDSEYLVEALLGEGEATLPPGALQGLLEKTEGNPLFVEETIRMLVERGDGGSLERIPDSLQALIAARIDRLPRAERVLLRRAAVIGRVFWRGALQHLAADLDSVEGTLASLLLRDLVLPETRSSITGEDAFRFKHVLIREVAFRGLSKSARADHHARFADWLSERAGDELLEIRAYHLDHAVTLLAELDGAAPPEMVDHAAAALAKAGKRALAREANRSARKLLLRAVELEPTLERRYDAARAAWGLEEMPAVSREMTEVASQAREAGDRKIEGRALTALAEVALLRDADLPRAKKLSEQALEVLEPEQRFDALLVAAKIFRFEGEMDEQERSAIEALELAQSSGRKDLEARATRELASVYQALIRFDDAQRMVERALELADESGSLLSRGLALMEAGDLDTARDDLDAAETSFEQARTLLGEAGASWQLGKVLGHLAWVATRRGDHAKAERLLREATRVLKPLEDRGALCEIQRALAETLVDLGRLDEAERVALEAIETVGPHDISSQASTRFSLGVVRAAQGRDAEAEELMRDAWAEVDGTGYRWFEAWLLGRLDQFLRDRSAPGFCQQRRPDGLIGFLVGRLADHRRGALEACERLGQRVGTERALPVGEVLCLVPVRERDVGEVDVEGRTRLLDRVGGLEHGGERLHVGERAVARRVHVREVEDRADPGYATGDLEHVVDAPEIADSAHHLDPEWNGTILPLQPLAQLLQLLDDGVDGLLAAPAQQEAWMEDHDLGSARLGDPRRVIQHADGHVQLLPPLGVAHEARDRSVHGEDDSRLAGELPEPLCELVAHPEPSLEVDLAGGVASLDEEGDGFLGALVRRHAGRAESDLSHARTVAEERSVRPGVYGVSVAKRPTRIDLLELDIDLRLADLWREVSEIGEWNLEVVSAFMRAAYGKGYCDALTEESPGALCLEHGYRIPPRRARTSSANS
jgi:predicted ATPase/class 3 adenylate cyclase